MPISSLVIRTEKNKTEDVAKQLKSIDETTVSEIHNEDIVVVTETDQQFQDKVLWDKIDKIPGVIKCDLIFHNFEDEEGFNHG